MRITKFLSNNIIKVTLVTVIVVNSLGLINKIISSELTDILFKYVSIFMLSVYLFSLLLYLFEELLFEVKYLSNKKKH